MPEEVGRNLYTMRLLQNEKGIRSRSWVLFILTASKHIYEL